MQPGSHESQGVGMRPWDLDRSEKNWSISCIGWNFPSINRYQQSTCENVKASTYINIWINLRGLSTQDTAALVANSKMSKASLLQNTWMQFLLRHKHTWKKKHVHCNDPASWDLYSNSAP